MDTPKRCSLRFFLFPKGFITDFDFSKDPLRILISQRIHYGFTPEKV